MGGGALSIALSPSLSKQVWLEIICSYQSGKFTFCPRLLVVYPVISKTTALSDSTREQRLAEKRREPVANGVQTHI